MLAQPPVLKAEFQLNKEKGEAESDPHGNYGSAFRTTNHSLIQNSSLVEEGRVSPTRSCASLRFVARQIEEVENLSAQTSEILRSRVIRADRFFECLLRLWMNVRKHWAFRSWRHRARHHMRLMHVARKVVLRWQKLDLAHALALWIEQSARDRPRHREEEGATSTPAALHDRLSVATDISVASKASRKMQVEDLWSLTGSVDLDDPDSPSLQRLYRSHTPTSPLRTTYSKLHLRSTVTYFDPKSASAMQSSSPLHIIPPEQLCASTVVQKEGLVGADGDDAHTLVTLTQSLAAPSSQNMHDIVLPRGKNGGLGIVYIRSIVMKCRGGSCIVGRWLQSLGTGMQVTFLRVTYCAHTYGIQAGSARRALLHSEHGTRGLCTGVGACGDK